MQFRIKQPSETRFYTIDFAGELDPDETISEILSVTQQRNVGLQLTNIDIDDGGKSVSMLVQSGAAYLTYVISAVVRTTYSATIQGNLQIQIED
jgi:hypothetical protein